MNLTCVTWQDKIDRAKFLASQHGAASDILHFYATALEFQEGMQEQLKNCAADVAELMPFVPELMKLLTRSGTTEMKKLAASSMALDWNRELESFWNERGERAYSPLSFLALTLLQPFARSLAARARIESSATPHCPFCFSKPQLGVLRPEGEGGKRFLLCSLCGTEWEYRRVICPDCGELDKEKLPVFKDNSAPVIKLAACDTCHTYLKCIDLSVDGHAIPEVDDIASLTMSMWMVKNGFHPVSLNLFGF